MTSPWQEWKKKNLERQQAGIVSPVDFINPVTEYVTEDVADERMKTCLDCPKLIKATHQCRECGCFMKIKTKLLHAKCPLDKW
jgi:hypothetical protein